MAIKLLNVKLAVSAMDDLAGAVSGGPAGRQATDARPQRTAKHQVSPFYHDRHSFVNPNGTMIFTALVTALGFNSGVNVRAPNRVAFARPSVN
jgi:hypothetical protein